jgi:predicted nucleotidyltransferase
VSVDLSDKLITQIRELARRHPIRSIVLFGSRARGDNHDASDIDLAVFPLPGLNSRGLVSSEIDELATLLKIDVVFVEEQTDVVLLDRINREGVVLYERSEPKTD